MVDGCRAEGVSVLKDRILCSLSSEITKTGNAVGGIQESDRTETFEVINR